MASLETRMAIVEHKLSEEHRARRELEAEAVRRFGALEARVDELDDEHQAANAAASAVAAAQAQREARRSSRLTMILAVAAIIATLVNHLPHV